MKLPRNVSGEALAQALPNGPGIETSLQARPNCTIQVQSMKLSRSLKIHD